MCRPLTKVNHVPEKMGDSVLRVHRGNQVIVVGDSQRLSQGTSVSLDLFSKKLIFNI